MEFHEMALNKFDAGSSKPTLFAAEPGANREKWMRWRAILV
jgi:hypothetical protein